MLVASFNRPLGVREFRAINAPLSAEFAGIVFRCPLVVSTPFHHSSYILLLILSVAVQFLERNGYDVTYCGAVDLASSSHLLESSRVFLSVGHDEYWSGPQRAACVLNSCFFFCICLSFFHVENSRLTSYSGRCCNL